MFCNGRADTLQAFTIIVPTSVGRLLTCRWSGGVSGEVFSHTCYQWLTGQFADKPARGQSSRGLVNSRISQLAESEIFLNHEKTTLYLHTKPLFNLTLSTTESVQLSNLP